MCPSIQPESVATLSANASCVDTRYNLRITVGGFRMIRRVVAVLFCIALFALAAFSQTGTSSISGTVTDTSGAVIPAASVTLTNENTGITYHQVTTEAGVYSFTALPVGPYTVSIEAPGFKTTKRTSNVLVVQTPLTIDMSLPVGETSDVVNV